MPRKTLIQLPSGFCHPHGDAVPTGRAHGTGARVPIVPGAVLAIDNRYFMGQAVHIYEAPGGNQRIIHLGFAEEAAVYTEESLDAVDRTLADAFAGRARSTAITYECPKSKQGKPKTAYVRHAEREFAALAHDAQIDPATNKPNWTKSYSAFADWPGSNVYGFQRAAKETAASRADPKRFVALGRYAVTAASTPALLTLAPIGPEAAAPRLAPPTLTGLGAKKRASPAPTASTTSSPTPSAASSSIDWGDSDDDDEGAVAMAPAKRPRSAA